MMTIKHASIVAITLWFACAAFAGEQVFFAFDDHSIPWHHNTKLTMVAAGKHPANPVLRKGPAGAPDHGHAILYGTVLHEGGKFRMWYLGMIEDGLKAWARNRWRPMCYAESDDGVRWTKPDLGLVEINGSRKNNACLVEGEPASLAKVDDFLCVLREPDDPDPARRYKAVFIAHVPFAEVKGGRSKIGPGAGNWQALITAASADGLCWKVVGDRPVNAGGERFEVSGLYRFGDFYYASGQLLSPWTWWRDGRDIGRAMLVYRSSDFVHWDQATAFSFARAGQLTAQPADGQQTHMGAGLWNRDNVLVGLYGMWQDGPKERPKGAHASWGVTADLGLILSNDGIHFREPVPDFKVLTRGAANEWDNLALLQGHAFANVGERTLIWYSHWDTTGELKGMEIGLAELRRDGFGYLSPKVEGESAHCITATQTANATGWQVKANVDGVSATTPLILELLDERAMPIPGYTARVTTSGTQVAVSFEKAETTPRNQPFAVRLRFPTGGDVRFYALYLE